MSGQPSRIQPRFATKQYTTSDSAPLLTAVTGPARSPPSSMRRQEIAQVPKQIAMFNDIDDILADEANLFRNLRRRSSVTNSRQPAARPTDATRGRRAATAWRHEDAASSNALASRRSLGPTRQRRLRRDSRRLPPSETRVVVRREPSPARQEAPAPVSAVPITTNGMATRPRGKKVDCTLWLKEGRCNFVAQPGCDYRHIFPDSLTELQRRIDSPGWPTWWMAIHPDWPRCCRCITRGLRMGESLGHLLKLGDKITAAERELAEMLPLKNCLGILEVAPPKSHWSPEVERSRELLLLDFTDDETELLSEGTVVRPASGSRSVIGDMGSPLRGVDTPCKSETGTPAGTSFRNGKFVTAAELPRGGLMASKYASPGLVPEATSRFPQDESDRSVRQEQGASQHAPTPSAAVRPRGRCLSSGVPDGSPTQSSTCQRQETENSLRYPARVRESFNHLLEPNQVGQEKITEPGATGRYDHRDCRSLEHATVDGGSSGGEVNGESSVAHELPQHRARFEGTSPSAQIGPTQGRISPRKRNPQLRMRDMIERLSVKVKQLEDQVLERDNRISELGYDRRKP